MARTDPHFKLRIPPDLLAELKEVAKRNQQSVTAEIVERLRESLAPPSEENLQLAKDVLTSEVEKILMGEAEKVNKEISRIQSEISSLAEQFQKGLLVRDDEIEGLKKQLRKIVPEKKTP